MTRLHTARLVRIALVALLFVSMAAAPAMAAPLPQPAGFAASQQNDEDAGTGVPGFGELPSDATLVSFTSGVLEEPVEAPVTLTVERLSVEPGASLDPVDGPQIIQVEQGLLTFEDDLGLEAEITAGGAQFFAPGEGDVITNTGDEPVTLVRTSVGDGASADANDEDQDQQAEGEGETRDRDDDDAEDENSGQDEEGTSASTRGFIAQETPTPDEVVITLTEDGFEPDEFEIVQGGDLVIENATEDACLFEIPDLRIETEIDAGDIESVTLDGSAGTHEFTCSDDNDEIIADGTFFLARPESTPQAEETPEATETEEPAATPEAGDESATPIAAPDVEEPAEATPTSTAPATGEAPMGVLLEATLETVPEDGQELFAAQIVLDPEGSLSLSGAGGALGVAVSGGDLTVTRPGHSPARLRDGRSVLLPGGTVAILANNGDDPITLQLAGLIGAEADVEPSDDSTDVNDDETADDEPADDGPADVTGGNQFFPADEEMGQLGLEARGSGPDEITAPEDNAFWFEDGDQAADLLPTFGWQMALSSDYDSGGDEIEYGEVQILILNVDIFDDESGATDYFDYVAEEALLGQGRTSDVVEELEGVTAHVYASGYLAEEELDLGYMIIQSGEYVISILTAGIDLDATTLLEDVAVLIFGPRG